jgi:hypothetical protein
MAVYAISGILLILDTDFKIKKIVLKQSQPNLNDEDLRKEYIKSIKQTKKKYMVLLKKRKNWWHDYIIPRLPYIVEKMNHLHKAKSEV